MFLFVNPLGYNCYHTECNILKMVDELDAKINLRFIPLLTLNTVSDIMHTHQFPADITVRNNLSNSLYQAALDYKAASFQGNKYARDFLLKLQKNFITHKDYNDDLVLKLAKETELDYEMFLSDRHSNFTRQAFQHDLEIAAEMKVTSHPSLVLYNLKGFDCGVLIDCAKISLDSLKKFILDKTNSNFKEGNFHPKCDFKLSKNYRKPQ